MLTNSLMILSRPFGKRFSANWKRRRRGENTLATKGGDGEKLAVWRVGITGYG